MSKKKHKPKTAKLSRDILDLIQSCEFHLNILWEAKQKLSEDSMRFKQIAGELRILICETRTNKPLLFKIMDQFGVQGRILPGANNRILMIGWREDPEYIKAYNSLTNPPIEANVLIQRFNEIMPEGNPVMLKDWIKHAVAIGNEYGEYSYEELILTLAQQMGCSHEDEAVDTLLDMFKKVNSNKEPQFLNPLLIATKNTLGFGAFLFMWLRKSQGYKPRYLDIKFFQTEKRDLSWNVKYPGA
ncbi:MAG: hypothetical protein WC836_10725 [Desulfobacula sp.]|jgi:hypothetical protein